MKRLLVVLILFASVVGVTVDVNESFGQVSADEQALVRQRKLSKEDKERLKKLERTFKHEMDKARYQNPKMKRCQVHGDSLTVIRFSEQRSNMRAPRSHWDKQYDSVAKHSFPNTFDELFPYGAKKGWSYKRCKSCDSAWSEYNRDEFLDIPMGN